MEKQKLIYVESKAQFSPSEVSDKAIVFIKDTKEIWTHGTYFICSNVWATPITLTLSGDSTGSVSIDGSGGVTLSVNNKYLTGDTTITDANNAVVAQNYKVSYYGKITNGSSNLFATTTNANAILTLNTHDYTHNHQLGFSSNKGIYHRTRNGGTWETSWREILTSTNYTNYLNSTYLQLTGGTLTDTLILKAGAFTAYNHNSYSGGRYQAVSKPNIRLIGDSTYGLSTIEFTSQKGDTSINRPSDSGFIQFQPYGVAELSSIGQNPTLKTTGESNALVLGVTNDTDDIIVLQSPNVAGLRHACGTTEYYLPHVTTSTTTANKPLVSTTTAHVYTLGAECLPLSGGTMTGKITLWSSNADAANTGGLNANNSNIYGLNSLYFADASETAAEGINFYRSSTTVDSLWGSNGNLYWTPNRTYGSAGTSYYVLTSNNYSTHLNNTYLPLSGGTMTGNIILTTGSSYIADSSTSASILGSFASGNAAEGLSSEAGVLVGKLATQVTIRSNGDDLWHYRNSDKKRYKILDAANYTNYTINYANSNINTYGSIGVIASGKLYYNSAISFARFAQHDNSGRYSYELIAELTNYGTGTNTSYITYGISGFMWAYREGNGANSCSYSITAIVNVGPAIQQNMLRVSATTNVLIPFVVKYNDKYYIALRKNNSSTTFYFMGIKLNLLTTTIIVDDASLIEEVQGPRTETSTASTFYNNGNPQPYLHSGNYYNYALPLYGGVLTGKLTMQANSLVNLPTINRTDAAYISGIRFQNTLGYLGAIGMNAVNGSLYILDTNASTFTILDSRNYNNYSPTLAGTGASGTWAINISGVAASASKVANALTIQLNGGTTAGTNKFVYDGSSAYTINITPEAIGASATSHTHDYLPLSGGTLGSSTASFTELFIKSSTANMRLMAYSDSTNYIQSGNSTFDGNATLKITGYSNTTGTNLYFNFANIYCRGGSYTNIDSGNYSSYALPLSGGTLTGTLISRDIRPSANLSYSLGTSSYYYNYVYANYFKKNGSSDSYVLLGGGGHKAVSDFAPNNVATLSSSGMGNSDQWTLVFEKSYPSYWYNPTTMFYIRSGTIGCGILCFYNYWASGTTLNDYEKEVWFFGAGKSETSITFGGANRDINDYFRIYIDKANFKYCMYYNRYNNQSLQIQELQFFTVPEPGEYLSTGSLRSSFFTNSNTVVDLPTESSTLVRVPIKTTYNHDRTIRTTKSVYASSFYENSDIRLKENVRGIDQSDLTKQVDLVQFNFKDNGTKKYGVIAQQLEQVGLQNLVYENNGNKAVDYISLLVLEIQRLRNEIGELKQEINKKS